MAKNEERKIEEPRYIERWVLVWTKKTDPYKVEGDVRAREWDNELDMLLYGSRQIYPSPFAKPYAVPDKRGSFVGGYLVIHNGKIMPRGYADLHGRILVLQAERNAKEAKLRRKNAQKEEKQASAAV